MKPRTCLLAAAATISVVVSSCSFTLPSDSELAGGAADSGGDQDSGASSTDALDDRGTDAADAADAARCVLDPAMPFPGCWAWEGTSTAGWTITAKSPDGSSLDCCGCAASCAQCVDNTTMSSSAGVVTFSSGPAESGGVNHYRDGFQAVRRGIPVIAGRSHTLSMNLVGLGAHIDGSVGAEPYFPNWTLEVSEGTTVIAALPGNSWSTQQCASCTSKPSDLGTKQLPAFVPSGSSVDVWLRASHVSSQCASEVWGVEVSVASMRVVAN